MSEFEGDGILRVYVVKEGYYAFECIEYDYMSYFLNSELKKQGILDYEVEMEGIDGFKDSINEILVNYEDGDVVEIVSVAIIEVEGTGEDTEFICYFRNPIHRKLTKEDIENMFIVNEKHIIEPNIQQYKAIPESFYMESVKGEHFLHINELSDKKLEIKVGYNCLLHKLNISLEDLTKFLYNFNEK